jgi:NADH dehydrogenase (ubiquinone) Fe-S protein 4
VSLARAWLRLSCLVLPSTSRPVKSGMGVYVPQHHAHHTDPSCSIYKPAKTATQSGDWTSEHWLMDWDVLAKGHRWENPLMGWASSADFMNGHRIQFKSKEDAINFANKQGYEYFVQEPNVRKFVPKAYANNFTHVPGKLKQVRTK